MTKTFDKRKLVLVEGKDELNLVKVLLKFFLGESFDREIKIEDIGGSSQFACKLPALVKTTGFIEFVEIIAIVRDAENNLAATYESIKGSLEKVGLSCPQQIGTFTQETPSVGIYLMPDNKRAGMMEDLFLEAHKDNPIMDCVNKYMKCLEDKDVTQPNNISKAKSQAFLAGMQEPTRNLGVAACKGYWNLENESLKGFLNFIEHFANF